MEKGQVDLKSLAPTGTGRAIIDRVISDAMLAPTCAIDPESTDEVEPLQQRMDAARAGRGPELAQPGEPGKPVLSSST